MNAANETNQDVIVFKNLRRPSANIAGDYTEVVAKAVKPTEPFVCANASGYTRVVESFDEIGELASTSGRKIKAVFGK